MTKKNSSAKHTAMVGGVYRTVDHVLHYLPSRYKKQRSLITWYKSMDSDDRVTMTLQCIEKSLGPIKINDKF